MKLKQLNEDSSKLLENTEFKWNILEKTMNTLITLLKDNDYLCDETNTILINVESTDENYQV